MAGRRAARHRVAQRMAARHRPVVVPGACAAVAVAAGCGVGSAGDGWSEAAA